MRSFATLKFYLGLLLGYGLLALLLAIPTAPALGQGGRNPLPGEGEPGQPEGETEPEEEAQPEQEPEGWKDPEDWTDDDFGDWEEYSREDESVLAAFNEVVAEASYSTVEVYCDGRLTALGAVVSEDGEILTKASEISGEIECVFRDGNRFAAEILSRDEEHDLALLDIEAAGLQPIAWTDSPSIPLGSWLVTPGAGERVVAIGVVSVVPRRILPVSGILGIVIEEGDRGPVIVQIIPGSGAESVGLHAEDIVLQVNGKEVDTREELVDIIREYRPGTRVELLVLRDGDEIEFSPVLGHRPSDPEHDLSAYQNSLGGKLSIRRAGFPSVLQHDTPLAPADCGGPILDLEGRAVGINIARAGRVNSYAVPMEIVQTVLAGMRGQEIAGADEVDPDVQQVGLAEQIAALEEQLAQRQEAIEAALAAQAEAQEQSAEAQEALEQAQDQFNSEQSAAEELQQRLEQLRAELAALDEAEEHGHEGEPHVDDVPENTNGPDSSGRNRNRN